MPHRAPSVGGVLEIMDGTATSASDDASDPQFSPRGVTTSELAPLWFVRYRLRLVPRAPLVLPPHGRGAILRGAFGIVLRRLVCHDLRLVCRACPLVADCPYPSTFEPRPPEGGDRLSNFSNLPTPFVIDVPADERAEYRPGEVLEFGLTVVGRAARLAPYYVTTFRQLADEGIGPRRARFDLVEVTAVGAGRATVVYQNTEPLVRLDAPAVRAADLARAGDDARTRLTVRFVTPMDLKDRGAAVAVPEFGPIVRRLRDRASTLASFFADGPLDLDWKGISTLADAVRLVENRTRVVTVNRRSSRTGQLHDIGGIVGEATYEGEAIGRVMPLVRLGEVVHVGRHAAFGNGGMEVVR